MNENILLVEEEQALGMALSDRLQSEGYVVDFSPDGEQGFEKEPSVRFDLIILDIMLPRRSGLDVCRDIRLAGLATPILLLTARGQIVDKVAGLKLGADDYVTKPFDTLELMARIEALLRRAPTRIAQGILHFCFIRVGSLGSHVTRESKPVYLSSLDFQLLRYFAEHNGITLSRDEILREAGGYEVRTFTRTVDVNVAG